MAISLLWARRLYEIFFDFFLSRCHLFFHGRCHWPTSSRSEGLWYFPAVGVAWENGEDPDYTEYQLPGVGY